MPDLTAAYEAASKALPLAGASRHQRLAEATKAVEAAYPHLLAAFAEKLLSDEALEALATDLIGSGWDEASAHTVAVEMFGTRCPSVDDIDKARAAIALDLREAVEAALAPIESNGGTGRG